MRSKRGYDCVRGTEHRADSGRFHDVGRDDPKALLTGHGQPRRVAYHRGHVMPRGERLLNQTRPGATGRAEDREFHDVHPPDSWIGFGCLSFR